MASVNEIMAQILKQLDQHEVIEDSSRFLREQGLVICYRSFTEDVLTPLQSSRLIRYQPFHLHRYVLAGGGNKQHDAEDDENGDKIANTGVSGEGGEVAWRRELERCLAEGSPEARIWRMVGGGAQSPTTAKPMAVEDLNKRLAAEPIFKGALLEAKKNGWVEVVKDKATGKTMVQPTANHQESISDRVRDILLIISKGCSSENQVPKQEIASLKKRSFVKQISVTSFRIAKGDHFVVDWASRQDGLTADHLVTGAWADVQLKQYDFESRPCPLVTGGFHVMGRIQTLARTALLEMSFEELPLLGDAVPFDLASLSSLDEHSQAYYFITPSERAEKTAILRSEHFTALARHMLSSPYCYEAGGKYFRFGPQLQSSAHNVKAQRYDPQNGNHSCPKGEEPTGAAHKMSNI